MGDGDDGVSGGVVGDGVVDCAFGYAVELSGYFVEQEDVGFGQQRPGEGDALSLAAGHVGVCEFGVEALWQGDHVFVESHGFQHRVDVFRGGAGVGEGEVVAQCAG